MQVAVLREPARQPSNPASQRVPPGRRTILLLEAIVMADVIQVEAPANTFRVETRANIPIVILLGHPTGQEVTLRALRNLSMAHAMHDIQIAEKPLRVESHSLLPHPIEGVAARVQDARKTTMPAKATMMDHPPDLGVLTGLEIPLLQLPKRDSR